MGNDSALAGAGIGTDDADDEEDDEDEEDVPSLGVVVICVV
jgi:hypothetical protein